MVCVTREVYEDLEDLSSDQEEADTRLLLHAKYAPRSETRIIPQSPDTEVLVLRTTHFSDISCEELWFRKGVSDHHRYVPVNLLCQKLGQKLCKALPAFHALTGCDTTSAIASVGKKKAWEVLRRSEAHQQSLEMVGLSPILNDTCRVKCETFICTLFPAVKKTSSTADELRYLMFCQKRQK